MIKQDLELKIKKVSEQMDKQFDAGNYSEYERLSNIYLRLIREHDSITKPNHKFFEGYKPATYFISPNSAPNTPHKWNEITCKNQEKVSSAGNLTFNITANTDLLAEDIVESISKALKITSSSL